MLSPSQYFYFYIRKYINKIILNSKETSVLTLAGISRVFHTKHSVILKMAGKEKAWEKMLDCVQTAATSSSTEMSKAAIGSFEELLNPQVENNCGGE